MQDFGHMGVTEPQIDLLTVAQSFCREKSPMDKVRALLSEDLGYDPEIWQDDDPCRTGLTHGRDGTPETLAFA